MALQLDNTRRSDFVACPRRYYLAHEVGLQPTVGSNALRYGTAWHAAMDSFYAPDHAKTSVSRAAFAVDAACEAWDSEEFQWQVFPEDDYRTKENLAKAVAAYCDSEYVGSEEFFELYPREVYFNVMLSLDITRNVQFCGVLDAVATTIYGDKWIWEYKTTSQSLFAASAQLERTPQLLGYAYAAKAFLGEPVLGAWTNIHRLYGRKRKDGTYGEPSIEFARVVSAFSASDLDDWLQSFLATAEGIQRCQDAGRWPKQLDSCYTSWRCRYDEFCRMGVDVEDYDGPAYALRPKWNPLKKREKYAKYQGL